MHYIHVFLCSRQKAPSTAPSSKAVTKVDSNELTSLPAPRPESVYNSIRDSMVISDLDQFQPRLPARDTTYNQAFEDTRIVRDGGWLADKLVRMWNAYIRFVMISFYFLKLDETSMTQNDELSPAEFNGNETSDNLVLVPVVQPSTSTVQSPSEVMRANKNALYALPVSDQCKNVDELVSDDEVNIKSSEPEAGKDYLILLDDERKPNDQHFYMNAACADEVSKMVPDHYVNNLTHEDLDYVSSEYMTTSNNDPDNIPSEYLTTFDDSADSYMNMRASNEDTSRSEYLRLNTATGSPEYTSLTQCIEPKDQRSCATAIDMADGQRSNPEDMISEFETKI